MWGSHHQQTYAVVNKCASVAYIISSLHLHPQLLLLCFSHAAHMGCSHVGMGQNVVQQLLGMPLDASHLALQHAWRNDASLACTRTS